MKIRMTLKAWLPKLWDGEKERWIELPEGTTCEQALESQGIYYKEIQRFGFVSLNGKRVLVDHVLQEGDEMNVFPRMNGG